MKISQLFPMIFAIVVPSVVDASLLAPPARERFLPVKANHLEKYISKAALSATRALILKRKCRLDSAEGYRSRKAGGNVVVTAQCDPAAGHAYREFPLTVAIFRDSVTEVDFRAHGFMYESGQISFITDIDANNSPEMRWRAR